MSVLGFEGSKILIVGGAGFVGSNICSRLLQDDPQEIIIVDNFLSSDIANVPLHARLKLFVGSITEQRILSQLPNDFDYIFHLATFHGNQSSMFDPLRDHDNNLLPTLALCEYVKDMRSLKKLVYASAGCVVAKKTFDEVNATDENASVSLYLDSPYQISKIVGEFYGNYYHTRHGVPFVKARFQNVYGPREVLGSGSWRGTPATVWRNVIPSFIWRAIYGKALPIENGGIATRDFIYVNDLVDGLIACALNGKAGDVYNLATGVETSILALAKLINSLTQNKASTDLAPQRNWDRSGRRYGSIDKAKNDIGFEALTNIEEGLALTIQWTKDNFPWIQSCILQHRCFMPELSEYVVSPVFDNIRRFG